jgi:hypothetical protein
MENIARHCSVKVWQGSELRLMFYFPFGDAGVWKAAMLTTIQPNYWGLSLGVLSRQYLYPFSHTPRPK